MVLIKIGLILYSCKALNSTYYVPPEIQIHELFV